MSIFERFSKRITTISICVIFFAALIFAAGFGLQSVSAQTTYTLSVTKTGTGASKGTVAADSGGIDCGTNCSAEYNSGDTVMLTRSTVAGAPVFFKEWGGACSGTGSCVVTMDEAKNVTARFEEATNQKCTIENPSMWGLRFRLTGANVTVSACQMRCLAGGGNGNFAINAPLGWCVCGTDRQPASTQPATQGCTSKCPGTDYECGGTIGQYSVYNVVAAPTAASGLISGRVLTADGRGVAYASVYLMDSGGNVISARTNPFGYYRFNDVPLGQGVMLQASSKSYQFEPRLISLLDSVTEIDFVANP